MSPEDLQTVTFPLSRLGRRGYDEDSVREFLRMVHAEHVRLVNDRLGRSVELGYDPAAFPAFFEWLNLREGAYAVGLEPSTHHVAGDAAARADGSMIWLGHGDERGYDTTFRFTRL